MRDKNTTATVLDKAKRLQQLWHDAVDNGEPCYLSLEFRDGKFRYHMNNAPRAPYRQSNGHHRPTGKSSTPIRPGPQPSPGQRTTQPSQPSSPTTREPEKTSAAVHISPISSHEIITAPPNGTPMQLRNNVNGRRKRKATVSPETIRNTNAKNPDLDVSFYQVSGRAFDADPADENESEVDSDVSDADESYNIRSQDDQEDENSDSKHDVSKRELTVSSDHFTTNRYAILGEESESLTPPSTKSEFNLPADAEPVIVTTPDLPSPNTAFPAKPKCVKCCQAANSDVWFCHDKSLEYVLYYCGRNPVIYCGVCDRTHFWGNYCHEKKAYIEHELPPILNKELSYSDHKRGLKQLS